MYIDTYVFTCTFVIQQAEVYVVCTSTPYMYMYVLAFGYGIVALIMCGQGTHVTNISSSSFIHSPFLHSHIPASAHSPSG